LALFYSWASGFSIQASDFSIKVKDAQNNIETNQQTNKPIKQKAHIKSERLWQYRQCLAHQPTLGPWTKQQFFGNNGFPCRAFETMAVAYRNRTDSRLAGENDILTNQEDEYHRIRDDLHSFQGWQGGG
jgi:hypothetical protein